jgi:hypothetical protein
MDITEFDKILSNEIDNFYKYLNKSNNEKDSFYIQITNFVNDKYTKYELFNTFLIKYLYYYLILKNAVIKKESSVYINEIIKDELYIQKHKYKNIIDTINTNYIDVLIKEYNSILNSIRNDIEESNNFVTIIKSLINSNKNYKIDIEHNILKTIILYNLYILNDRIKIYNDITFNNDKTETKKIDIVLKTKSIFDFSILTDLLTLETDFDIIEWYDFIMSNNVDKSMSLSLNEKINFIFQSNIQVYPIVDDILLHHKKDLRIYENIDKKNTRSSITVDYINNNIKEIENRKGIDKNNLTNAIYINYLVLLGIVERLYNQDISIIKNKNYSNIMEFLKYPYINYTNIKFPFTNTNNNQLCIRHSNILQYKNINSKFDQVQYYNLNYKISNKNTTENVIGMLLTNDNIHKSKLKHLCDINSLKKSKEEIIYEYITNYDYIKKQKKCIYYLFENTNEYSVVFNKIYDKIIKNTINKIQTYIINNHNLYISAYFKKIQYEILKIFNNQYSIKYINYNNIEIKNENDIVTLGNLDYLKQLIYNQKIKEYVPIPKEIYKILNIDYAKYIQKSNWNVINLKKIQKQDSKEKLIKRNVNVICQHYISNDYIKQLKDIFLLQTKEDREKAFNKKDPLIMLSNKIYQKYTLEKIKFTMRYIQEVDETTVCRSCGAILNSIKYESDGKYDSTTGVFISDYSPIIEKAHNIDISRYTVNLIKYLDIFIYDISTYLNLTAYTSSINTTIRINKVKEVYNYIKIFFNFISEKRFNNFYYKNIKKTGINLKNKMKSFLLNDLLFNNINFTYKNFNTILSITIVYLILEFNVDIITTLPYNELYNYNTFQKHKKYLFKDIKIFLYKNKNKLYDILLNETFCYILYYASALFVDNNIYDKKELDYKFIKNIKLKKNNTINLEVQRDIIMTFSEICNSFIYLNFWIANDKNKINYKQLEKRNQINFFLNLLTTKFYFKLALFNGINLSKTVTKIEILVNKKHIIHEDDVKMIKLPQILIQNNSLNKIKDIQKMYFEKQLVSKINYNIKEFEMKYQKILYNELVEYFKVNEVRYNKNNTLIELYNKYFEIKYKLQLVKYNKTINQIYRINENKKDNNIFKNNLIKEVMSDRNIYLYNFLKLVNKQNDKNLYIIHNNLYGEKITPFIIQEDNILTAPNNINIYFNVKSIFYIKKDNEIMYYDKDTLLYLGYKKSNRVDIYRSKYKNIKIEYKQNFNKILNNIGYPVNLINKQYDNINDIKNILNIQYNIIVKILQYFKININNLFSKRKIDNIELKSKIKHSSLINNKYIVDVNKYKIILFNEKYTPQSYFLQLDNLIKVNNFNIKNYKINIKDNIQIIKKNINEIEVLSYYLIKELTTVINNNIHKKIVISNFITELFNNSVTYTTDNLYQFIEEEYQDEEVYAILKEQEKMDKQEENEIIYNQLLEESGETFEEEIERVEKEKDNEAFNEYLDQNIDEEEADVEYSGYTFMRDIDSMEASGYFQGGDNYNI